jgi:hypothetical protein
MAGLLEREGDLPTMVVAPSDVVHDSGASHGRQRAVRRQTVREDV